MRPCTALFLSILTAHAATPPNAAELLKQAIANDNNTKDERAHYIYKEHAEHRAPGANATLHYTKDYEWIFLDGQPYRKWVAENGKPLRGQRAQDEEHRFQMTRQERKHADSTRKFNPRNVTAGIDLPDIARLMDLRLLGEETLHGRPTWVIEANPKTDAPTTTPSDREHLHYKATVWIDQHDFILAQKTWEITTAGADALPGSKSLHQYQPIAPGIWLPSLVDGEFFSGPPHPRSHWRQIHRFTDYRRFGSESTVVFEH